MSGKRIEIFVVCLKNRLERFWVHWEDAPGWDVCVDWRPLRNRLIDMRAWARCVVAPDRSGELICPATASDRMRRAKAMRLTPSTYRRKTKWAWAVQSDFPQLVVARTDMKRVWLGIIAVEENERKALFEWRCKDMYGMKYLSSTYSISKEHSWKIAFFPRAIPLILSPGWSWFLPSSTRAQAPRRVCLAPGLPTGVPSSRKSLGEVNTHST